MSYQVIARKWRPQTFEEVTGQEHITRTLRNAVEHERLHHAYLFSGARGVGKTTTARLLAKAVNCHRSDRPTPTPCRATDADACPSCREIAESRSIDVQEIDAASNTGVDNVRDAIISIIDRNPARDRYQVFIIDEVHMLSISAFNALLKTLEEPPPRVLFIMATTHAHKVPETILSRSQRFEFRTIAAPKIAERLRLIADAEGVRVTDEALREVARAGEGSMRDAQSAFDQVISFSEGEIGTEEVEAALGIAGSEMLSRVMRAVVEEKPAEALAVVADLVARGHDLRNFCRDMLAHVRDLLVAKVSGDSHGGAERSARGELAAEARDFSESDLVRFFNSLTETETRLRESSAHPRYQLEIGLVKLVEMRRLAPLAQIIERLGALEEALRTGRAPAAGAGTQTPPASGGETLPPRRGSAAGGGPASFSAPPSAAAANSGANFADAPAPAHAEEIAAKPSDTPAAKPSYNSTARPQEDSAARPCAPNGASSASNGAARAGSAATTPNLKLVPPPASSGGAPSFAAGSDARAAEAPFALGDAPAPHPNVAAQPGKPHAHANGGDSSASGAGPDAPRHFFDEVRAGEDRVGQPVSLVAQPAQPAAQAVAPTPAPAFGDDTVGLVKRGLEGRMRPLLAVALDGARRVLIEDEEVRVEFAPEGKHLHDTLRKPENQRLLREVCCEVLGRSVGMSVTVRAAGARDEEEASTPEAEARREQRRMRDLAEANPVVQQLLKTFRAEIVDVRPGGDAARQ